MASVSLLLELIETRTLTTHESKGEEYRLEYREPEVFLQPERKKPGWRERREMLVGKKDWG